MLEFESLRSPYAPPEGVRTSGVKKVARSRNAHELLLGAMVGKMNREPARNYACGSTVDTAQINSNFGIAIAPGC